MEDVMRTELKKHQQTWNFLLFCHFEHEMEKTVELANGIGLGCREAILAEIKALKNDPKNKTAGCE